MAAFTGDLKDFLQPLHIDVPKLHRLSKLFCDNFTRLAAESEDQFLSTPVSDSVLRAQQDDKGRFLAVDIGGTNLRVAFIEMYQPVPGTAEYRRLEGEGTDVGRSRVHEHLFKEWPIAEHLKSNKAADLFDWIGECMAEVVLDGVEYWRDGIPTGGYWPIDLAEEELPVPTGPPFRDDEVIPVGITFSFPMIQETLADATLMPLGKGFAISSNLDLATQILAGYDRYSPVDDESQPPKLRISAICNDAVATLVAFAYLMRRNPRKKVAMGLIVGTGCNATIPLSLSKLHPNKRPKEIKVMDEMNPVLDVKVVVNTEWTINGAAGPLHELNLITEWDKTLDAAGESPGFQPLEYMTAGRYLGELGRIIAVEWFTKVMKIPTDQLPQDLLHRHGLSTSVLGDIKYAPLRYSDELKEDLEKILPSSSHYDGLFWTDNNIDVLHYAGKEVQRRASSLTAAAIIGLLACAGEVKFLPSKPGSADTHVYDSAPLHDELVVGYTGGCFEHFQDYLQDCQETLNAILREEFGPLPSTKVVLAPCTGGGIFGAGILAGTVEGLRARSHEEIISKQLEIDIKELLS